MASRPQVPSPRPAASDAALCPYPILIITFRVAAGITALSCPKNRFESSQYPAVGFTSTAAAAALGAAAAAAIQCRFSRSIASSRLSFATIDAIAIGRCRESPDD